MSSNLNAEEQPEKCGHRFCNHDKCNLGEEARRKREKGFVERFGLIPVLFAFDYERQLGSLDANSDLMKAIVLRIMKGEKYNFSIGFNKDEVLCFSIQPDRHATAQAQKDPDRKSKCIVNFCDNYHEMESPLCHSHLNRPTR